MSEPAVDATGLVALDELIATATENVTQLLDLRSCTYEPFPFDTQLPRIEPGRVVLPAAEPGIAPWSTAGGVELPIRFRDLTVGRLVLVPRTPTSGVAFPPIARARALELAAALGPRIASEISKVRFTVPSRDRD